MEDVEMDYYVNLQFLLLYTNKVFVPYKDFSILNKQSFKIC